MMSKKITEKEMTDIVWTMRRIMVEGIRGFAKYSEMMRRLGIIFTKRQKRKIKKLVRRNKFWNAQRIILRKLSRCFGRNKK